MNEELLISIAFPGDTYSKIVQDLEQFDVQKMDDEMILRRKSIEFHVDFSRRLVSLSPKVPKILNELFTCNINIISPKFIAEIFFNDTNLDAILDFLKRYDNSYFWRAFGITTEKGNSFHEKMNTTEDKSEIFSEIHAEIIKSSKLNREIILNELLGFILPNQKSDEDFQETFSFFVFILHEVRLKYPSVEEALRMVETVDDSWILSVNQNLELFKKNDYELSPKILFGFIRFSDSIGCSMRNSYSIHCNLTNADIVEKRILLNAFKTHRYGYEAYQQYLDWCEVMKVEPVLKIGNIPECYFYNSYKVPQIQSLYKRYFSELTEEDAKEKNKECFEKIYDGLREEGFLDAECRKEEFLWAFGLTDEYPFAFKKIKFYTLSGRNKKDKGNGAFLCLLAILGYTSEEVKAMLHRNPEKSIINKTFDLTLKDNTNMSKDYDTLLEIVKSSGLPIKG